MAITVTKTVEVQIDLRAIAFADWPEPYKQRAYDWLRRHKHREQQDLFPKEAIVAWIEATPPIDWKEL